MFPGINKWYHFGMLTFPEFKKVRDKGMDCVVKLLAVYGHYTEEELKEKEKKKKEEHDIEVERIRKNT